MVSLLALQGLMLSASMMAMFSCTSGRRVAEIDLDELSRDEEPTPIELPLKEGLNLQPDRYMYNKFKGDLIEKSLNAATKPLLHQALKSNPNNLHFGLNGLADAGVTIGIKAILHLVNDTMAYKACTEKWQNFHRDYPDLVENFVTAMKPAVHKWRGGSWKSVSTWTEQAQTVQRTVMFLTSPNMVEDDGEQALDLDREYAMIKWCGWSNQIRSGMLAFIQVLAFQAGSYYFDELSKHEWWTQSEPIWGRTRRTAMWRVYTEAWGYDFHEVHALAWRRGGHYQVSRNAANESTVEIARLEIAPFVDTLPLAHFRQDGHAAYPPNIQNDSAVLSYALPYLREVIDKRQLILENQVQYQLVLEESGKRTRPLALGDFDTFWSLKKADDPVDVVQFVVVAASPEIAIRQAGALTKTTQLFCNNYIDWNGDLVPWERTAGSR